MSAPRLEVRRAVLIALLLAVAVAGTANFQMRRLVPVRAAREGDRVVITNLRATAGAEAYGVREGDVVRAIDGKEIRQLHEASWALWWVPPYGTVEMTLVREDSVFTASLPADRGIPLLFLLLDRLTGLAFLFLGLLVWWHGRGDPTVLAFLRVNVIVGVSIMMNDFPSVFGTREAQAAFAGVYLAVRSLIPSALVDFIFRFTSDKTPSRPERSVHWASWALGFALAAAISVSVAMARLTSDPEWVARFDALNRVGYGSWLLAGVTLTVARLVYAATTAANAWRRKQLRWLLLCLVFGATPYVVLEKLPTLWGWSPLIVPDLAMAMLLITPIGWAMAVASFHMLRVQWTLSRTFVYVVTAGIAVYAIGGLMTLSAALARRDLLTPTAIMILLGVVLIVFVSRALVERVRWAVDRAYYGDWFDYRAAVRGLETKLSNSLREQDIVRVLTEDVPAVLRVERCTLVVRGGGAAHTSDEGDWRVLSSGDTDAREPWLTLLPAEHDAEFIEIPPDGDSDEYVLAVPLTHAEIIRGWLLLGRKTSGAPFSEQDYRLLSFLAPMGGMALVNIELNRRLVDQERRLVVIELAGGIAHEIGNALSPLMGQAQLLEHALKQNGDSLASTAVAPPLKIITDMCGRIRRIVQNLARLSQPVVLEKSAICLNEVADEVIQLMSETAGRIKRYYPDDGGADDPSAPYRLHRDFCADMPVVYADRQQLSQVFINLFMNAADSMEPMGRGVLTVGTGVSIDPPGVIGFVQDTGPGIPPELTDKLFLPYFTTKPQGKGTGMGLSFVQSIVEAHQGWVRVKSPAEGGTRFEFFLPAVLSNGR